MGRKRPLRNPLPPPPPSPSPSPPSIRKEESKKGHDIAEDEDNEEQMSTDSEEDDKEEEEEEEDEDEDDDDDEEVQKVEKEPHVGELKATVPTPSKSDSGSDSENHFTIKPVVSKLAVPKPTKKMTEKAVTGGSGVELILGLACEEWEMGVKKPKRTSKSRLKTAVKADNLKTAVKADNLKTAVKTDNLKTEVTTEEKVGEVEGSLEKYTALDEWLEMGNVPEGVKWVMRKRLREIEKSKVRGLEERWRSLRKAELELFVQTMDFVSEQLKLVLEAASNSAELEAASNSAEL